MGLKPVTFQAIQDHLDTMKAYIHSHGGDVELVSVEKNTVLLALKGTCQTCPLSFYTFQLGVQTQLQAVFGPDILVKIQDL